VDVVEDVEVDADVLVEALVDDVELDDEPAPDDGGGGGGIFATLSED
jgi:hypothetical protein